MFVAANQCQHGEVKNRQKVYLASPNLRSLNNLFNHFWPFFIRLSCGLTKKNRHTQIVTLIIDQVFIDYSWRLLVETSNDVEQKLIIIIMQICDVRDKECNILWRGKRKRERETNICRNETCWIFVLVFVARDNTISNIHIFQQRRRLIKQENTQVV